MSQHWLHDLADTHGLIPAKTSPVAPLCELVELLLPETFPPTVDSSEHVEFTARTWSLALRALRIFPDDVVRECLITLPSGDSLFLHVLWDERAIERLGELSLTFVRFARSIDPVDAATLTAIRRTIDAAQSGDPAHV
ncbi:MAG: hypothetical protein AAFO80_08275 [Pseudomonadota bacterium]